MSELDVSLEFTPNPNTLKFVINRKLLDSGAVTFNDPKTAESCPLASDLLGMEGVVGLMFGRNFLTLTKTDDAEWDKVYHPALEKIKTQLNSSNPLFIGELVSAPEKHQSAVGEIELKIKKILDEEIRPAVAMDGGDITFEKFDQGVVYLLLQGSCSGCPSSTMTLKMGIEARLKEVIPEVTEVVSI